MRRSISVLAVLCFLSCAVPLSAQKTPGPPKAAYEDADGYVVLSILLSHAHSEDPSFLLAPFLLSPLTVSGINADSFQSCSRVPTEFASAAADFRDKNKQNWNLTKKINLKFRYKFTNLTGKHTWLAPTQNSKDVPPALFETSVYQVSAVGFDASRTHAIAYVGAVCGPDCGNGSYHLLVKEREGWKETTGSPVCQWMSFDRPPVSFLPNNQTKYSDDHGSDANFAARSTSTEASDWQAGC
jgi:hypothetical protein